MKTAPRFLAFTLAELLIVLVIMGIMMTLATGFTKTTRDTFVAQQYTKTVLTTARILRRKSMLISRNSGETKWVNGIGFKITKDVDNSWVFTQQRLLSDNSSYYYHAYPAETVIGSGDFEEIPNAQVQRLQKDMSLKFAINSQLPAEKRCVENLQTLYVIFESINGTMHAYCLGNGQFMPLGSTLGKYTPNLTISTIYQGGKKYEFNIALRSNGEISVKQ